MKTYRRTESQSVKKIEIEEPLCGRSYTAALRNRVLFQPTGRRSWLNEELSRNRGNFKTNWATVFCLNAYQYAVSTNISLYDAVFA